MDQLSSEIFGDVQSAAAAVLNNTPAPDAGNAAVSNTPPQDVDESQGNAKPASSGEESDTDSKQVEAKEGEDESTNETDNAEGKPSKKAVESLRAYGDEWKSKAEASDKRIKDEYEPLITEIEEKFGGRQNLNLASEVYRAIADEENFDPETAIEFLAETAPTVAQKLLDYVAQDIIETARGTALEATFGRKLNEKDITNIKGFLANGQVVPSKFEKHLSNGTTQAVELLDKDGNPLPDSVQDFLREQQRLTAEATSKVKEIENKLQTGEQQALTAKAQAAIEEYVSDNLAPLNDKVSLLGLDKPFEGETPELAEERQLMGNMVHALSLYLAGQDKQFKQLYDNSLRSIAKASTSKVEAAKAADYSERIKAKMAKYADKAATIISPLIEARTNKTKTQVDKGKNQRPEITSASDTGKPKVTKYNDDDDPFDTSKIRAEVSDIRRQSSGR